MIRMHFVTKILDLQETLVDIGNASKTEIDIPANFD